MIDEVFECDGCDEQFMSVIPLEGDYVTCPFCDNEVSIVGSDFLDTEYDLETDDADL